MDCMIDDEVVMDALAIRARKKIILRSHEYDILFHLLEGRLRFHGNWILASKTFITTSLMVIF